MPSKKTVLESKAFNLAVNLKENPLNIWWSTLEHQWFDVVMGSKAC